MIGPWENGFRIEEDKTGELTGYEEKSFLQ